MTTIQPFSLNDCLDFIRKHKEDIQKGIYNIQIESNWIPSISLEKLVFLTRFCPASRITIALNPNTPGSVLEILVRDYNDYNNSWNDYYNYHHRYSIKAGVAANPNTPVSVLEILARDGHVNVRVAVAANPNTPVSVLEILARDGDVNVRVAVAANPNTPVSVLEILAKDKNESIRVAVAANPNFRKNCFIATAAYGTAIAPEVFVLKAFRDNKLMTNIWGKFFVKCYYKCSPPIAKFIANSNLLKKIIQKILIKPLVYWVKE